MPPVAPETLPHDALTRVQRLIVGLILLLAVDLIWVASAEFTEYIFHTLDYEKPYFTTYFKSALFGVYLFGFVVHKPWRDQCTAFSIGETSSLRRGNTMHLYSHVYEDEQDADEQEEEEEMMDKIQQHAPLHTLSSPMWVPANIPESGRSSGAESDGDTS